MTITKQWLQKVISEMEAARDEIPFGLDEDGNNTLSALKMALTSLSAEPVGEVSEQPDALVMDGMVHLGGSRTHRVVKGLNKMKRLPLRTKFYIAPPAPVVPDARYQHLSDLYHAQEKRLFKLAQRIKGPSFDKYAYSPSQAIDVLEAAIFGESAEEDCRAAMLNHSENDRDMVERVSQPYKLEGGENCWSCGKYFTYEQHSECDGYCPHCNSPVDLDEAVGNSGNSPAIPDAWQLVPKRLTAENGAKGALSGEFSETKFINCPECFGDEDCETCDGSGRIEIIVPVTWSTIKAIWAKGVEHFSEAPQQEVKP